MVDLETFGKLLLLGFLSGVLGGVFRGTLEDISNKEIIIQGLIGALVAFWAGAIIIENYNLGVLTSLVLASIAAFFCLWVLPYIWEKVKNFINTE